MILRGVNLNSLGDYYQDDPHLPPVVPVTGADWDAMAAHGFNVVRLLVSWSTLEPQPGHDRRRVRRAGSAAPCATRPGARHLLRHRHAPGRVGQVHRVAAGRRRARRARARRSAGTARRSGRRSPTAPSTCTPGSREDSPAVLTAWDSFYADRDGIMDHLVAVWGELGHAFAREPAVAGLRPAQRAEPRSPRGPTSPPRSAPTTRGRSTRSAPARPGRARFHHIVFFETTVFGVPVPVRLHHRPQHRVRGRTTTASRSATSRSRALFDYFQALANAVRRTAVDRRVRLVLATRPRSAEKLVRYAAKEDALLTAGDAWWQWRQACGDPHSIGQPGGTPDAVLVHFQRNGCPGDHNLGVVPEWSCRLAAVPARVARPAHRAQGCMHRRSPACGSHRHPGNDRRLVSRRIRPTLGGWRGRLSKARVVRVPGGFRITAQVTSDYTLQATST